MILGAADGSPQSCSLTNGFDLLERSELATQDVVLIQTLDALDVGMNGVATQRGISLYSLNPLPSQTRP